MTDVNSKVTDAHLNRDAYLYIRQSTLRQVFENQESTKRQYALRERAIALGWSGERVQVIDSDLGHSGSSTADREGFLKLVAEVSMGRVGIVLGLEVSRLARNNADWHRLLEICALSDTLILDEDGIYNPNDFNDRLLLGLKGTMSEAELHFIRARLRGGLLSKARRGELAVKLPVGFVYDDQGHVQLDPDKQVQETIKLLFATYRRTGSASATVKYFRQQGLSIPHRVHTGLNKGELAWDRLTHFRTLHILHNPRYAGAFFFGRTRLIRRADGRKERPKVPRDQWYALIPDAHDAYITWEEYEDNQRRLLESAQAHGSDRRQSPPREGPALLQGIVLCGICGKRMAVRYRSVNGRIVPDYRCERDAIKLRSPICQRIRGDKIDLVIGGVLLETITPMTLQVALAVQQELTTRLDEADRLRAKQVERARYEADLARKRFMLVDPLNRLVADALEADWNGKLRALREAQEACERRRSEDRILVDEEIRSRVMALTNDFPRLWNDPNTSDRDRKRIVRLLIEDVTLLRNDGVTIHIRFKGGAVTTLHLSVPECGWRRHRTPPELVKQIDDLLEHHYDAQITRIMNERNLRSGRDRLFHRKLVSNIRRKYGLKSHYDRLREAGKLTAEEMAVRLGVCEATVRTWLASGLLTGHPFTDANEYLYDPPDANAPKAHLGLKLTKRLQTQKSFVENP